MHATVFLSATLSLGACDWFTDFKQQPSVHTWGEFSADSGELKEPRSARGLIGTNGTLVSIYQVSGQPMPGTVDSVSFLANPVSPTTARCSMAVNISRSTARSATAKRATATARSSS